MLPENPHRLRPSTPDDELPALLTVAGFGLHATRDDILFLVRRPPLLARSLTAMFAIMPAAAIAMAVLFRLHPAIEIALVVLGLSPMPPLLPRRQLQGGTRLGDIRHNVRRGRQSQSLVGTDRHRRRRRYRPAK